MRTLFSAIIFVGFVSGLTFAGSPSTTSAPASRPAATQPANEVAPEVDALLTKLEKTGGDMRDLQAEISDEIYQIIPDDRQVKTGILRFRTAQGKTPGKFMIHFNTLTHEDLKLRQKQWLCFNGRWLREISEQTKTAIDREFVMPDENIDPYKLGEGFFPLPFGQKKADILKTFRVTLAKPEKTDPPGSSHLVLTPKPKSQLAKKYERIDFWVDGKTNLPARLMWRDKHSVLTTIDFKNTKINSNIPDADLWIDIPKDYAYQREPLEGK